MVAPFDESPAPPGYGDLATVVKDLAGLRVSSHKSRYGEGALPVLPSRTAIAEIAEGLVATLFPRHFGPPGLAVRHMDGFVSTALRSTLQSLEVQVRRELRLSAAASEVELADDALAAHDIVRRFAAGLPDIRRLLESDIIAAYAGDPAATSRDEVMCCYPGVAAIIHHRLAHDLYRLGIPMIARIISEATHSATGIDIHPGAEIGESFFIDHGTGVVIGGTAIIGRRVRLYQAVTLGAKRFEVDEQGAMRKSYPRHPVIEDDVVIYAGATILGRITVGRGAVISGNVWVTQDVPPGATITQAQARNDGFESGDGI
jgi:serine O-acetyltransferase